MWQPVIFQNAEGMARSYIVVEGSTVEADSQVDLMHADCTRCEIKIESGLDGERC